MLLIELIGISLFHLTLLVPCTLLDCVFCEESSSNKNKVKIHFNNTLFSKLKVAFGKWCLMHRGTFELYKNDLLFLLTSMQCLSTDPGKSLLI